MMNHLQSVRVFAPATSANLAVGFDVLGFAVDGLGDEVSLSKSDTGQVIIEEIIGTRLVPMQNEKNTATVALGSMLSYLNLKQGFNLRINKKIPISSGLGGSAACSIAAVFALNQFLLNPLDKEQLIEFALYGEQAACGVMHGDNIVPCLFGGMTLIQSLSPLRVISLPSMPLQVVLAHPHILLSTRESRALLNESVSLGNYIKQNARIAAFVSALYEQNYERLESSCLDDVVEPMRAHLIPGFYAVKTAAYQFGALACSISGSGPTVFALAKEKVQAEKIAKHMRLEFNKMGIKSDLYITNISEEGAKVTNET